MRIENDGNLIVAAEGKVLRRISDGLIVGSELWIGYTHYLNGKKLNHPLLELPEHYEETDALEIMDKS